MCRHEIGSAVTRYDRATNRLIFTLVCDECHRALKEQVGPEYKPNFVPTSQPKVV